MNVRLNRLCIGGLLALGASLAQAQTSVTLYGTVAVELVHVTGTTTGTLNKLDDSKVTGSRLGFKGAEDLGCTSTRYPGRGNWEQLLISGNGNRCIRMQVIDMFERQKSV